MANGTKVKVAEATPVKAAEAAPAKAAEATPVKPVEAAPAKAAGLSEEQKKERIAELTKSLQALFAKGETSSPLAMQIMAEIAKIGKAKAPKAEADPAKLAEKEALQDWLRENAAEIAKSLNEQAKEGFPILAAGGMSLEVVIRVKGVGRSGTKTGEGRANLAPRIVHRKATGERFINEREGALHVQGLPSLKKLLEAYPKDADRINAVLGSAETRKKLWNESGKDKTKVYVTLSDKTYLTLQS